MDLRPFIKQGGHAHCEVDPHFAMFLSACTTCLHIYLSHDPDRPWREHTQLLEACIGYAWCICIGCRKQQMVLYVPAVLMKRKLTWEWYRQNLEAITMEANYLKRRNICTEYNMAACHVSMVITRTITKL